MSYLELEYYSWERQEAYGMFDYSEQKNLKNYPKITIKRPGKLFRNKATYQLKFIEDPDPKMPAGHEPFIKI